MCEILDHVDFDRVAAAKAQVVYGLLRQHQFHLPADHPLRCGLHLRPLRLQPGHVPRHPAIQDAMDVLMGRKQHLESYGRWEQERRTRRPPHAPLPGHGASGAPQLPGAEHDLLRPPAGGCVDCLVNFLGTCYDNVKTFADAYRNDGILWFLESCDLNVMGIRRAIWQMQHAYWFGPCQRLSDRPSPVLRPGADGLDQYHAVIDLLEQYHVPIVMDVDIGHLPPPDAP